MFPGVQVTVEDQGVAVCNARKTPKDVETVLEHPDLARVEAILEHPVEDELSRLALVTCGTVDLTQTQRELREFVFIDRHRRAAQGISSQGLLAYSDGSLSICSVFPALLL